MPKGVQSISRSIIDLEEDYVQSQVITKPTYTPIQLGIISKHANDFDRLLLYVCVNCAFGAAEMGRLTVDEVLFDHRHEYPDRLNFTTTTEDSFIRLRRPKATGDVTHSFLVRRASFIGDAIYSQRTAGPPHSVESSAYRIVEDEHFDRGSTFQNSLASGAGWTVPVNESSSAIRFELWNTSGNDTLILSGIGTSFPVTFSETSAPTFGAFVKFFYDVNGTRDFDDGIDLVIQSEDFQVRERKNHTFDVVVAQGVSNGSYAANVANLLAEASGLLLRRDGGSDYRAAIEFTLGTITVDTSLPGTVVTGSQLAACRLEKSPSGPCIH